MFPGIQNSVAFPSIGNKKGPIAKISIVGMPAVGKTTLKKLLCSQEISGRYNPTQGFDLGKISMDGIRVNIWDFGGQKSYIMNQMSQYIQGSDIIFVVTDSSPINVLATKELLEYSKNLVEEDCEMVAIANKQDLPGHMEPRRVSDVLRIPTVGMVAIESENRDHIMELMNSLIRKVEQKKMR